MEKITIAASRSKKYYETSQTHETFLFKFLPGAFTIQCLIQYD